MSSRYVPTPLGGPKRGIPRVGSIAPRASEGLYARFLIGATPPPSREPFCAPPSGSPQKTEHDQNQEESSTIRNRCRGVTFSLTA